MLGAVLAAALATQVAQPAPPPATPAAVQTAAKDPDPLICHSEASSGTRLTHRVCLRKSELAQRSREDRQALDGMAPPPPSNIMGVGPMGPPR